MTPRRGELEPAPDRNAGMVAGGLIGMLVGCAGWIVGAWGVFLPIEWTFGAGWWAPVVACGVLGAVYGRSAA